MPRKMLHSFRALAFALGLLTVGLVADSFVVGTPTAAALATGSGTRLGLPADADATVAPTSAASAPIGPSSKSHSRHRRVRDSMALPFYSFAQVLRRGNRS